MPEDIRFALALATDEACSNVVTHGYEGREPGAIRISFERIADGARVTIVDWGHQFSPTCVPLPDLDAPWQDRRVGGLGWYFITSLVDDVRYDPGGVDGNTLILTSFFDEQGAQPEMEPHHGRDV